MTASVHEMKAEAGAIGQRRPDAIRPTAAGTCPSHAALLHRVAALITTEDLPAAKVTVALPADVTADLTGSELVENGVRRWSAALSLDPVTETATEVNGWPATQWSTSGFVDGAHFIVTGTLLLPTPIVDRFGCGIGPAT